MLSKLTSSALIKTTLKLLFSIGALIFIFQHLELDLLLEYITTLNPAVIALAFAVNAAGQYISARRLHFYCQSANINITQERSVKLYFTGMFFNNLLPGGIGGDGYIAIMLKRIFTTPIKRAIQLLISARASGLLWIIILSSIFGYFSEFILHIPHSLLIITIGLLVTIIIYSLSAHYLLKEQYRTQLIASMYSFAVQGCIALVIYLLLKDMQVAGHLLMDYMALLLLSNILIIIPISFGGLGLRELGFLYASQTVGLNPEVGIAISLLYYSFGLILSLTGLWLFTTKHGKIHAALD